MPAEIKISVESRIARWAVRQGTTPIGIDWNFWISLFAFGFACFGAGVVAASSYLMIFVAH